MWPAILIASGGCFALKLAGLSIPARFLEDSRAIAVLPVALLAALVGIQTFASGDDLVLDARVAGLAAALAAVRLRAPFLVVVAGGAATTALVRAVSS
jgi:branched chain amino acid efflux pump